MKNLLLSEAIGDISGKPYEFHYRTKNYDAVNLLHPKNDYTDDTVCTFACAEALMNGLDVAQNLWHRCREEPYRGYGGGFMRWLTGREKGAVAAALVTFHCMHGKDKDYIKENVLKQYYPSWYSRTYADIKPSRL